MITIEQLKATQERLNDLHRYLDIENKLIQLEEEELRTQVPGFWEDQKAAEAQMKVVKGIRNWIEAYNSARDNVNELATAFEFYKEEIVTEEEVDEQYAKTIKLFEDIELKNMLQGEEDHMNCVLKINAGAGGTEANDWAQQLMRLYMRYAEDHGYTNCCHYTDNGFSGTSTDRIALQAMMLAIERDEIDTVIVSTLNRLSRDYEFLFGTFYPLLEKHGVKLLAVDGSSELHNVYESKNILECLAEMEREKAERTA